MALDPIKKIEITAHSSIMDALLEKLQSLSVVQIDPHSIKEWEENKSQMQHSIDRSLELKRELGKVGRAISFLGRFGKRVSLLARLSMAPEVISKTELNREVKENSPEEKVTHILEVEKKWGEVEAGIKEYTQKISELKPFTQLNAPLTCLLPDKDIYIIVSRLEREEYERLQEEKTSELIHIEKISGEEIIYFFLIYHIDAEEIVDKLQKRFGFESVSIPISEKRPSELIDEYRERIAELEERKLDLEQHAKNLVENMNILQRYHDYLETEIEKENVKDRFFFTEKVFLIHGWIRERDVQILKQELGEYEEVDIQVIEKEEDEKLPVVYKNNRLISPFEMIVNLYSPPNPNEVDPTPFLMPFYAVFFGICLTEAGYGLLIMLFSFLGLRLLKPKNGMRKFLNLFFILGAFSLVIGVLMGTIFGINFEILPENLAWLREARYKIMIFDSSKDVLTFFALCLTLGVIHLITGYLIKIFMLFRRGEWAEAVCEHLPWIFLLLSPLPKVLIRVMPQYEQVLNLLFYVLLALWAGIILLFSERSSLNPIKRIGKGLFTLYGVSGVLGDVLSYSRLLALGLATGVIAGVVNTLAGMVKQLPIVGIAGLVIVLVVGHLFNLFISGLSAFVHSIRLQFMEFFTKFYTGEGELLTPFSEKRKYTYAPVGSIISKK